MHYRRAGDGPPVVLLHGWPQTSYCWHKIWDRLAEGHTVTRLAVLDIIPTREMWRRLDAGIARGYWHWLFHLQPDLPALALWGQAGLLGTLPTLDCMARVCNGYTRCRNRRVRAFRRGGTAWRRGRGTKGFHAVMRKTG